MPRTRGIRGPAAVTCLSPRTASEPAPNSNSPASRKSPGLQETSAVNCMASAGTRSKSTVASATRMKALRKVVADTCSPSKAVSAMPCAEYAEASGLSTKGDYLRREAGSAVAAAPKRLSMSARNAPGSIDSSQRTASGSSTRSSTTPMIGVATGIRSTGDTRYSNSNVAPGFSQPGASGWRAYQSRRASPSTSTQNTVSRFHMRRSWGRWMLDQGAQAHGRKCAVSGAADGATIGRSDAELKRRRSVQDWVRSSGGSICLLQSRR